MSSITITKKPTKRDYITQLAKLYKIKGASYMPIPILLVKMLSETLKDANQRKRVIDSSIRGYDDDLTHDDWETIEETIVEILEQEEKEKEKEKEKNYDVVIIEKRGKDIEFWIRKDTQLVYEPDDLKTVIGWVADGDHIEFR